MINFIDMRALRNAEFIQFVNNVSSIIQTNDPAVLNVVAQLQAFKIKITELSGLFKNEQSSPLTEDVQLLDVRRDRSVTGLGAVIEGYTYYFQPEKAEAARLLQANMKLYGAIARQNYQAETALISEMMNDWENKPELVAALTLLDLVDWKDELYFANNSFNETWLARTHEYATASPETLKQKRDETTAAYYELKKFLEAYATINSTVPVYHTTVNDLNALIEQYNAILNDRASSGGDNDEPSEGEPGGGDDVTPSPLP
ncbi:MAG TPA: DUF6261 family protein [Bacteroidales bacterium]